MRRIEFNHSRFAVDTNRSRMEDERKRGEEHKQEQKQEE